MKTAPKNTPKNIPPNPNLENKKPAWKAVFYNPMEVKQGLPTGEIIQPGAAAEEAASVLLLLGFREGPHQDILKKC